MNAVEHVSKIPSARGISADIVTLDDVATICVDEDAVGRKRLMIRALMVLDPAVILKTTRAATAFCRLVQ